MDGVQKTTRTVLVLYVAAALLLTSARGLSTKGNEFYLAFMGNDEARGASDQNAILFVTTEETSPVQVTVEVNPAFYQNNPNLDAVQFPRTRMQTVVAGTSVAFNFSVSADTPPNGGFPDQDIRVYDLASSLDRSSGIKVSTDGGQISVYGINNEISSVDAFSVYPCHEYPTIPVNNDGERFYEYVILSTTEASETIGRDSRLMIVGCQDDTDITITPLTQLNTLPANLPPGLGNNETPSPSNPLEITIDILQTYLVGNAEDLSGTRVRSNKPIALFGGHECARVPNFILNCDYLVQQIPPEPTWGDRFFIIPVPERYSGDFYRAATTTSDTVLSVTCRTLGDPSPSTVTHAINNEMRWVEFNTAAATSRETRVNEIQWCSVESNHPVLLMQYAQGSTADAAQKDIDRSSFGDPFMTIVPPITQYANDFTVPTAKRLRASPLFPSLTIAIPQGDFFRSPQQDQTRIRLNSETVEPDEGWVEIFCSDGQVCGYGGRIESAPEGTVIIEHSTPEAGIAVWVYGIAPSVSFGMTAGFRLDPIAFPNLRIVEDVTVTESDDEAVVRIIRTGDLSGGSRFNLRIEDGGATGGVDYRDYTVEPSDSVRTVINATTNEIRMRANIEEVTFRFQIVNDTLNEGTEKFFLHITPIRRINAVLTPTGTVTILDSGLRIQFGLTDCSFSRSESDTVSINVIRFAGLSQNGDIVVDITPMTFSAHESMGRSIPSSYQQYDPAEPTDFDNTNQRITFTRGGESEMTVQITTFDDDIKEFDEAFVVVLNIVQDGSNTIQPPEAGRDVVVCTIRDDEDSVNIELDPTSVDLQEGDVAVGISVTKSAVSECSLQSVLSIDDAPDVDRALEGQDFVIDSLDVIIPAFETANSIPISGIAISDDSLPEVTEGFRVSLRFKDFDTTCSEQNCSRCDCCRTAAVQNIFTIATTVSTVVTIQDNDDICAPNPCNNGGICNSGAVNFTCECVAGYTGELCETDIDDCVPNPCQNGGTCTDGVDTLTCDCVAGYTGELCETDIDECAPNPCQNGGTCTDGVDTFICNCAVGYTGAICDVAEPQLPPQPDITDVSLIRRDDLHIRWRLPDGVDLNRQPVDIYIVEVRCVGRVDSVSVAVSELLERSVFYRDDETTNTEVLFTDIELRNKTYLVRVCAQSGVGETCSGYEIFTPPLPPRPEITDVTLVDDDDLGVKWRLPDGADTTEQPVDNYAVEVRCVDRLESEERSDVDVAALLADSAAYRNDETEDTEIIFADVDTNNKTYIIRVCAQSRVGMTCSEYEIFTPPVSSDSSDLPPGIIVVIVILVILGCCCCWLCLLILFFWCLRDRDRQGNYYPYKREKKYRQQYTGYREEEEDSEDFEEDIDVKA